MPTHDLTPQLRSRLRGVERLVGLFVLLSVLLLVAAFGVYLHHRGTQQGWFLQKVPYYVYVEDATGLNVGDPVHMMGFEIGQITTVLPSPPTYWFVTNRYNVFIRFEVREPNYGYIWEDSVVRVRPGDILGNRQLEIVKGMKGEPTAIVEGGRVTKILSDKEPGAYVPLKPEADGFWLYADEMPVVSEKVNRLLLVVENALPSLTNQLHTVLAGSAEALSNLNGLALGGREVATNLAELTRRLNEPDGALGRWLLSSNLNHELAATLGSARQSFTTAQATMTGVDSNFVALAERFALSLDHLADITSNLNAQVQSNTNVLSEISDAIRHTDELVQGLKRHWFLKSAFKTKPSPSGK